MKKKFMPIPWLGIDVLQHRWSGPPSEMIYKVPVELKEMKCAFQSPFAFREALRLPYQPADPFSEYPIEVLDVGRLYVLGVWIAVGRSLLLVHHPSLLSDLHKLAIVHTWFSVILGKDVLVVIVSIGEDLYPVVREG